MLRLLSFVLLFCTAALATAQSSLQFVTLGTASGPDSNGTQAQPANALLLGNEAWLVDAGDGAVGQLAKVGVRLQQVKGVFISHLHFDHTGGLLAVLGLRTQMEAADTLTVYGPLGTRTLVNGLLAAMAPAMNAANGLDGVHWTARIDVRELKANESLQMGDLRVSVAENSHFISGDSVKQEEGFVSLSYRFEVPGRSVVFTGDTGPSAAVAELARGADVLVTEMMDKEFALDNVKRRNPNLPAPVLASLTRHFAQHHVTPEEAAAIAVDAKVKELVVTHFAGAGYSPQQLQEYGARISRTFKGRLHFARDLERH